jgi:hypothetical protein
LATITVLFLAICHRWRCALHIQRERRTEFDRRAVSWLGNHGGWDESDGALRNTTSLVLHDVSREHGYACGPRRKRRVGCGSVSCCEHYDVLHLRNCGSYRCDDFLRGTVIAVCDGRQWRFVHDLTVGERHIHAHAEFVGLYFFAPEPIGNNQQRQH